MSTQTEIPPAKLLSPAQYQTEVENAARDHMLSDDIEIKDLVRGGVPREQAITLQCCAHASAIRTLLRQIAPGAPRDEYVQLITTLCHPDTPDTCARQS